MILLAEFSPPPLDVGMLLFSSLVIGAGSLAAVWVGYRPAIQSFHRREREFDRVLRGRLLMDVAPRLASVIALVGAVVLGLMGLMMLGGWPGVVVGLVTGLLLPPVVLKYLERRRRRKLEGQLVAAIQTLASGVRAGLNLVQAMELIARDGAVPLRQEFRHLLREYEYGVPLDDAMGKAAARIGSSDFRLLFSALQTHRERGGDLGDTLDRIASSIREIQRLEKRVEALTAQGRTTARWLGAMPLVVMGILYVLVDKDGVRRLFTDDLGNVILAVIILLNVMGFLWIRKIVSIDI